LASCPRTGSRLRPHVDVGLLAQPVHARQRPGSSPGRRGREARWGRVARSEPPGRADERGHMHTFEHGHL
jgi:hypothetical protein